MADAGVGRVFGAGGRGHCTTISTEATKSTSDPGSPLRDGSRGFGFKPAPGTGATHPPSRSGRTTRSAAAAGALPTPADGKLTYIYDKEGDRTAVTAADGTSVSYNYNQALEFTGINTNVTYVYNGDGQRMSKTVAGTTLRTAWDETSPLPTILNDGGQRLRLRPRGIRYRLDQDTEVVRRQ